jgi:succinate-semialdehyde dehydrogenase / glutarate-semialdehyde dehydrogenase
MGLEEARSAIDAAGEAFKSWGKTTAKERHDTLMRFFRLMGENADDLARIIVRPHH